ncbi:hypothetical protein [Antarcticirhabdus aurantiaca]|uniref:hypothetical protein n=1 Tax=Antarcticirhabdus aurantiaca TaxID=2606717 RepID=UPI00131EC940|nr:hypothetical protein [Antarcticirhabdus aurantiaca]
MTERDEERRRRSVAAWIELAFDETPGDLPAAVVEMWASGGTSTKVASWVLGTDLAGLLRIAGEHGILILRDLSMRVVPETLPESVIERLQALADENPEDDE